MSSELANLVGSIRPVDDTDLDRTAAVYAVLHRIDVAGETPPGARQVLDALGLTEHARAMHQSIANAPRTPVGDEIPAAQP